MSLVIYKYFSNSIKNYNCVKNVLLKSLLRSKYFIIISEKINNGRKKCSRISKILKRTPSKISQIETKLFHTEDQNLVMFRAAKHS